MPVANVLRIMRRILPPHAKISEDAMDSILECVTEFISFITSEANALCRQEYRRTITAEDLLKAMTKLGFDNYAEALTTFFNKHRGEDLDHRSRALVQPCLNFVTPYQHNIFQHPLLHPQTPILPPPPPPPVMQGTRPYVPLPPATNYSDFAMMNNYFMGSMQGGGGGGGEGCSKGMDEFDPFK
ncbi:hypothetical protein ACS0TY_032492 [Phlomoides rotata]